MATTAIGSFHARASLDATEFDRGAQRMSSSIAAAGRVIDDNWNAIGMGAKRAAEQSAAAFAKGGLGPIYEVQPIKQAATETARLTVETKKLWAAQVQARVAANALAHSMGSGPAGATGVLRKLGNTTDDSLKGFRRMQLGVQNAGYQFQDFFVQVAGGQSKLVALSQQLPQLLGSFGVAGALAGVAVTAGTVAYQFVKSSDAASEASRKFRTLKEATDALAESQRQLALVGKDEFAELPFLESEVTRAQTELDAITAAVAKKQAAADEAANLAREMARQGISESANALAMSVTGLAPTEDDKKAIVAAEIALTKAQTKLGELKEKRFQQDRENENALLDAGVSRISKELTAEFNKAKEVEKLDDFREKKQRKRMDALAESLYYEIYGSANMEKTIMGLQNRLPQSLQINTGASAWGGVTGGGVASQTLDIQKQILDGIRTLVRMEQMASSGYN